jgi:hypothetical protein
MLQGSGHVTLSCVTFVTPCRRFGPLLLDGCLVEGGLGVVKLPAKRGVWRFRFFATRYLNGTTFWGAGFPLVSLQGNQHCFFFFSDEISGESEMKCRQSLTCSKISNLPAFSEVLHNVCFRSFLCLVCFCVCLVTKQE